MQHSLVDFPLADILQLIRSEHVGPVTFHQLVQRFGSPAEALMAIPDMARRGGQSRRIVIAERIAVDAEIAEVTQFGARYIRYGEADYPSWLAQIADAPPLLMVRGNPSVWQRRCIAMVGSRNASANGCALTRKLARECGEQGLTVISGLARGIDTAAHQGALESGTVGVIAGGIDTVYPPENARLYDALAEKGAILSESPFGADPIRRRFHGRNRIISGMAEGTLVMEAAPRSGSLITARFALEQNREVMAVPGSPLDPRSQGTNDLIRQGAYLITSVDDILQALSHPVRSLSLAEPAVEFDAAPTRIDEQDVSDLRTAIESCLGPVAVDIDALALELDAPMPLLQGALLELELAGRLQRAPGGKVALIIPEQVN